MTKAALHLVQIAGKTPVLFRPDEGEQLSKRGVWEERVNNYGDVDFSKSGVWEKGVKFYGANDLSNSAVWVDSSDFYGPKEKRPEILLVGFDTEFKAPSAALTHDQIKAGEGKVEVLSYQVYCQVMSGDEVVSDAWGAVFYPLPGDRLSFSEILNFAIWRGLDTGAVSKLPRKVTLIGHFTRADMPNLSDFEDVSHDLDSLRNTIVTLRDTKVQIPLESGELCELNVALRDTLLLTPASSKSLKALGDLVGEDKIPLHDDPEQEKLLKSNMDRLLLEDIDLFERYALQDALICVRYAETLIGLNNELTGEAKLPLTLSGIGVNLLWQKWNAIGADALRLLGKEQVTTKEFDKRLNRYRSKKVIVPLERVSLHLPLASEAYHGGRNEQFWFGPGFEDVWYDYDLSGAYPTAMALIRTPDWDAVRATCDPHDFTPTTLGVARVEFTFPGHVRFPSMPVRTENGLVFPLQGVSFCGAPEIALALSMDAEIKITDGVVVPWVDDTRIFGEFISDCVKRRKENAKGSLLELFWKEISNSSYGKTAQGLREKRVYSLKERGTVPLPESRITNAFFAAFITSFVRATLGEIMNALPAEVSVFSCTTDGFLTNAREEDIKPVLEGTFAQLYQSSRKALIGEAEILEVKHRMAKPLGWRTRGQATLIPARSNQADDYNFVLAKGGIYSPEGLDTVRDRNAHIIGLFFERTPETMITISSLTGIREMVTHKADLVGKTMTKKLSMEYDWKRRPVASVMCPHHKHVAFSTRPWSHVAEFVATRDYWSQYISDDRRCIKTVDDLEGFATYVLTHSSLPPEDGRYLRKRNSGVSRLRQSLCRAWHDSAAGLTKFQDGMSNGDFAQLLSDCGVKCSRADVENGRTVRFKPRTCPPIPTVFAALDSVQARLPTLATELFVADSGPMLDFTGAVFRACTETQRVIGRYPSRSE